jgi:hypothetical protein
MKLWGSEITEQYDDIGLVYRHHWIGPWHLSTVRSYGRRNGTSFAFGRPGSWIEDYGTIRHGPVPEHVHLVLLGADELLPYRDKLDRLWRSPEPYAGVLYREVPCQAVDCAQASSSRS